MMGRSIEKRLCESHILVIKFVCRQAMAIVEIHPNMILANGRSIVAVALKHFRQGGQGALNHWPVRAMGKPTLVFKIGTVRKPPA